MSAAYDVAGRARDLSPTLRERLHVIALTVPSDHRNTFVQQPVRHRRSHQARPE
jgi:hypothetical protein